VSPVQVKRHYGLCLYLCFRCSALLPGFSLVQS